MIGLVFNYGDAFRLCRNTKYRNLSVEIRPQSAFRKPWRVYSLRFTNCTRYICIQYMLWANNVSYTYAEYANIYFVHTSLFGTHWSHNSRRYRNRNQCRFSHQLRGVRAKHQSAKLLPVSDNTKMHPPFNEPQKYTPPNLTII